MMSSLTHSRFGPSRGFLWKNDGSVASALSPPAVDTVSLPAGIWKLDTVHSSVSFAVKHMGVGIFRGRFERLDVTLTVDENGSAELTGVVYADSLTVKDENLQAHLGSSEFFDLERYPEISFLSRSIERAGEELDVIGALTIKDKTHPVTVQGTIAGPSETMGGAVKIGLTFETVIDRTQFGLDWNAPLPSGEMALGEEVSLTVELELVHDEG